MPVDEALNMGDEGLIPSQSDDTGSFTEDDVKAMLADDGADASTETPQDEPKEESIIVNGVTFRNLDHLNESVQGLLGNLSEKDRQIAELIQRSGQAAQSHQPQAQPKTEDRMASHKKALFEAAQLGPDRFVEELLTRREELKKDDVTNLVLGVMQEQLMPVLRPVLARQALLGNPQAADVHGDAEEITFLASHAAEVYSPASSTGISGSPDASEKETGPRISGFRCRHKAGQKSR
jgi:hypothetical protein